MSISPFDHPFLSGLIGDDDISQSFSAESDIAAMLLFEAALAKAQAAEKVIDQAAAEAIEKACNAFSTDMPALRAGVASDGVVIPELIRQLREAVPQEHRARLHFGATSQDVIDTSLMIRLKPVMTRLDTGLHITITKLDQLEKTFGDNGLMGRTRMQAAIPITVKDRIESWRTPLLRHRGRLASLAETFPAVQFGGAAGTLEKLGEKGPAVRQRLAHLLGLHDMPQWHSQRDIIVEFADFLSLVSGSLGKIGQDIALLAQDGDEISLKGGGKSSAMPHKQNPVLAELLVSLSRFNATQISGIHRQRVNAHLYFVHCGTTCLSLSDYREPDHLLRIMYSLKEPSKSSTYPRPFEIIR